MEKFAASDSEATADRQRNQLRQDSLTDSAISCWGMLYFWRPHQDFGAAFFVRIGEEWILRQTPTTGAESPLRIAGFNAALKGRLFHGGVHGASAVTSAMASTSTSTMTLWPKSALFEFRCSLHAVRKDGAGCRGAGAEVEQGDGNGTSCGR
jgi:hypothetical protein